MSKEKRLTKFAICHQGLSGFDVLLGTFTPIIDLLLKIHNNSHPASIVLVRDESRETPKDTP
jgi:hypothetical protein